MSNLPEGSIRELFSNATNVPVIRSVMTIFPLISWWDGKLFLYYPTWWVHPLLPKPYHTIQPVNKNHWHSLYPWRNYFFKVHCCFFYVISIPCMRLFSTICWWVSRNRYKMDQMQLAPWFWGFVKILINPTNTVLTKHMTVRYMYVVAFLIGAPEMILTALWEKMPFLITNM